MNIKNHFENTMHYIAPSHGGRGIVRTGMLIPECYQLFVCPFACGRHGAIGARNKNFKDRLSYVYIQQSDIISGYDDLIVESVGELLEALDRKPKVLLIMVSCLDDLIGTDHDAILETLNDTYPDIKFISGHMNPISTGTKLPPPVSIQRNLYSVLNPAQKRTDAVNIIGSDIKIYSENEMYTLFEESGNYEIHHISDYEKFDEYQEMATSKLNIVTYPVGKRAAEDMEKVLGIPFIVIPVQYRIDSIGMNYKKLFDRLSLKLNDKILTEVCEKSKKEIQETLQVVGDYPIIVDNSATTYPFELARALIEYGFNVQRIVAQEVLELDKPHYKWIVEQNPKIDIQQPQHHDTIKFDRIFENSLSVGINGAYITKSKHVARIFNSEGLYGYHGLSSLMEEMREAMKEEVDLQKMIDDYGLVV